MPGFEGVDVRARANMTLSAGDREFLLSVLDQFPGKARVFATGYRIDPGRFTRYVSGDVMGPVPFRRFSILIGDLRSDANATVRRLGIADVDRRDTSGPPDRGPESEEPT